MVVTASYSQYRTFAECPNKWRLSRKYETKRRAAALDDGQAWHLALAKFYTTRRIDTGLDVIRGYYDEIEPFDQKDADTILERRERVLALAGSYWKNVAERDLDEFEILAVEPAFKIRLKRGLYLQGYIDAIFRHKRTGIMFIVEHKHQQDLRDELLALDLQVSLYTMALLPKYGLLPTLYNVCRKPAYRRSEKKGETVVDFHERVTMLIEKEGDSLEWAYDGFESRFHVRRAYSRGKADLTAAHQQALIMAGHMRKIQKDPSLVWRNVGEGCLYRCSFRDICIHEDPIVIDQKYIEKNVTAAPSGAAVPVI